MFCCVSKNLPGVVAGYLLTAGAVAQPTVHPLFEAGIDTLGNPLTYPDGDAAEITGALVTMAPGHSTGWHFHRVPTFGYLLSGELTVEYATGESRVFETGDGILEAQHTVHNGHNRGNEPISMLVFSAGAPGVPTFELADPPRPADFVALRSVIPDLRIELRYFGNDNFIGRPISGYEAEIAYLTGEAASALKEVQQDLSTQGLGLKVFDGYRPQRAVDDFMAWAADPDDTAMKAEHYPGLDKAVLVPNGYIAERSGHSRGSTIDLTLIRLDGGEELDMGSPYDFFGPVSWPASTSITEDERSNRMKLREVMLRHGFVPLETEWWHFTLRDEPYHDTYFDFPVR
jgi:D-alanyl-D-alanine dipeptidase